MSGVSGTALAALALAACADAFAEGVTWQPATGPAIYTRGIFEAASRDIEVTRDSDQIEVVRPRLGLDRADLPPGTTPGTGETFIIRGGTYVVVGTTDDGMGALRVDLNATDQ